MISVTAVIKPLDRVPSIVLQTYENKDGKAALIKEEIINVPDVVAPLVSTESEKTLMDDAKKAPVAVAKQKKMSFWKSVRFFIM
jgi:hypothetical protein